MKKIIEFIKNLLALITQNVEENEVIDNEEEIIIEDKEEPIVIIEEEEKIIEEELEPEIVQIPETIQTYQRLTNKEIQTYLKTLGYYEKNIDGKIGTYSKKAIKQFNITFLNNKTDKYSEDTDKLLRAIYKSYKANKYMTTSDWKYFKNFKKSEFHCTCKNYCDGYNGLENKQPMRMLFALQYERNYFNASISISSSIRCPKRNKEIGGVNNSPHTKFLAFDHKVKGKTAEQVRKFAYANADTKLPFIKYAYNINKTYVHESIKSA